MADKTPQTYANHAKLVPLFHYVTLPVLLINLIWSGYQVFVQSFSVASLIALAVAVAIMLTAFFARVFALKAQDRVIRLEERLRMQGLLPDDLKGRINDYTTDQLIALRFASDTELPALARKVLDDGIADRKSIKETIETWKSDYQRV